LEEYYSWHQSSSQKERQESNEFVSSFDCILKYLNQNEVIIGTPASVRQSFLKGLSPQVQERVQCRLYNLNLIWQLRDGSSLLPDLKEIRDKFDMMELMEETLGSAPQAVQPTGGLSWAKLVTQEKGVSLTDAVKELGLVIQRSGQGRAAGGLEILCSGGEATDVELI
ncbi:hypothetical protein VP01_8376g1, partial [Puccinia sorghi]